MEISYSGSLHTYLDEMRNHFNDCCKDKKLEINEIVNIVHPYSLLYDMKKQSPFKHLALMYCEDFFVLKELRLEPYQVFSTTETETIFGDWECCSDFKKIDKTKTPCFQSVFSRDPNVYYINLLHLLVALFETETEQCVIKISLVFWKPILEAIYLLNSLFKNVSFIKPDVSNWLEDTCYIVCKEFQKNYNSNIIVSLKRQMEELKEEITIDITIPLSFIHQIEEFNVLTGKGILNKYNQINHLFKYKKHIEQQRIEEEASKNLCFQWCKENGISVSTKEPCTWKRNTTFLKSSLTSFA